MLAVDKQHRLRGIGSSSSSFLLFNLLPTGSKLVSLSINAMIEENCEEVKSFSIHLHLLHLLLLLSNEGKGGVGNRDN
jgi:hypothetical protein